MKFTTTNLPLCTIFLMSLFAIDPDVTRAQLFYANTGSIINEVTITPSGCLVKPSKFICPGLDSYFSIAYYHDTMYIAGTKALYYTTASNPGSCPMVSELGFGTSLVAGPDGIIYGASDNRIIYYDPQTHQVTQLDTMPYYSVGDLIFYNSKLYMAADPNFIVEVNLSQPILSKQIMTLSSSSIFGLAASPGDFLDHCTGFG